MSIAVTGAAGQLGRLVIDDLLSAGIPGTDLIAIARDPDKASALTDAGVQCTSGCLQRPRQRTDRASRQRRVLPPLIVSLRQYLSKMTPRQIREALKSVPGSTRCGNAAAHLANQQ